MRRFTTIILGTASMALLVFSTAGAYTEPSLRLQALGRGLVGIVEDDYTDVYRNPAYLADQSPQLLFDYGRCTIDSMVIISMITIPEISSSVTRRGHRLLLGGTANPFPFLFEWGMGAFIAGVRYAKAEEGEEDIEEYFLYDFDLRREEWLENRKDCQRDLILKWAYAIPLSTDGKMGFDLVYRPLREEHVWEYELVSMNLDGPSWEDTLSLYRSCGDTSDTYSKSLVEGRIGFVVPLSDRTTVDLVGHLFSADIEDVQNLSRKILNWLNHEETGKRSRAGDEWGLGVNVNIGRRLNRACTARCLMGFAYNDYTVEGMRTMSLNRAIDTADTTVEREHFAEDRERNSASLTFGLGLEINPRDRVMVGMGVKGSLSFADDERRRRGEIEYVSGPSSGKFEVDETVTRDGKDVDLLVPVGLEIMPTRRVAVRFGVTPRVNYDKIDGERKEKSRTMKILEKSLETSVDYTFGLGYEIGRKLSFDLETEGNFAETMDWRAAMRVLF